jgi:hypothetical protein
LPPPTVKSTISASLRTWMLPAQARRIDPVRNRNAQGEFSFAFDFGENGQQTEVIAGAAPASCVGAASTNYGAKRAPTVDVMLPNIGSRAKQISGL